MCLEAVRRRDLVLGVPNDFAAIWIHDNYLDLIMQRLRLTAGRMVTVTLRKSRAVPAGRPPPGPSTAREDAAPGRDKAARPGAPPGTTNGDRPPAP